jgi:hypothetical protein
VTTVNADGSGPEIGQTGARFGGASRRKVRKRAARATDQDDPAAAATEVFPAVVPVVLPGVATPQPPIASSDVSAADEKGAEEVPDSPAVGSTGARFGGGERHRHSHSIGQMDQPTVPRTDDPIESAPPIRPVPPPSGFDHLEELSLDPSSSSFVRPYVFTRGRTRSQFDLSIEALVTAVPGVPVDHLGGEHQAIVDLCRQAYSVAEIAALLGVPLGVARVLVGDLAAAGAVALHRTADAGGPDLALMERVLAGLRRL